MLDSEEVATIEPETMEIRQANLQANLQAGELYLEIQDSASEIRRYRMGSTLVVGSAQQADIVVRDRTVSGRHCKLAVQDGGITVRDLGSKNGTYVGGARVYEAWGSEGMTILIGQTTIVCAGAGSPQESDDEEDVRDDRGDPLPNISGASSAMGRVARQVRRLARLSAPVLIAGETGVGKELVARALHAEGHRKNGPFIALNVAALPRELIESELFGHERGAFTGAVSKRAGAFNEAEGGTLFLDEIGELPLDAQPKLLRALDGYEVRRIGGAGSGRSRDVRVIAATHLPLLDRVRQGLFRRDLYHRLEVFVVELPPLRARRGDILPIARTLLGQMAAEIGDRELTSAAVAHLTAHDWPGNVRELRNVLLRAADLSTGERWIDTSAIVRSLRKKSHVPTRPAPFYPVYSVPVDATTTPAPISLTPENAKQCLLAHGGNVSAAARAARIPRTTFRKILARAGIDTEE